MYKPLRMTTEDDERADLLMDRLESEGSKLAHDNEGEDSFRDEDENPEMVAEARRFYRDNQFALFVSMLSGLLGLMYVPSISRVHHAMGTTKSAVGAFRRYLSTINHVDSWYGTDSSKEKNSLSEVRSLHHRANSVSIKRTHNHLSQLDMAISQWAFVGPIFAFPHRCGVPFASNRELESLAHFWLLIGRRLGMKDEFNLMNGTLEQVKANCRALHRRVTVPTMSEPSEGSLELVSFVLEGTGMINPAIFKGAFLCLAHRIFDIPGWRQKEVEIYKNACLAERVTYTMSCFVFDKVLTCPYFGSLTARLTGVLVRVNMAIANRMADDIAREHGRRKKREAGILEKFRGVAMSHYFLWSGVIIYAYEAVKKLWNLETD